MRNVEEKAYLLAWSQVRGIGPILLQRILQEYGSFEKAWKIEVSHLLKIEGIGKRLVDIIKDKKAKIDPQKLFAEHSKKNPFFITQFDEEYPNLLLEIPSPPSLLYYAGKLDFLQQKNNKLLIGIVGTRKPTNHGRKWTYQISKTLAKKGFIIVSGLAAGIDAIAHQACLDAGGKTIAVLGNGLDISYPYSNAKLYQEIKEKGLILSEYAAGVTPNAQHFPARNRIVAGLCRAVLVLEAPERSGALITARLANEFGRDVYSLPDSPDNLQSRGCLRLIHKGAEVIITENELLSMLGEIPDLDQPQQLSIFESQTNPSVSLDQSISSDSTTPSISKTIELEPSLAKVFNTISYEATSFDAIVEKSGLSTADVSGTLLQLEIQGLISSLPGMFYKKN